MISAEEAAAVLLAGQSCPSCHSPLPADGEPCGDCGRIPATTGPELAEALASAPLAVAEVEAQQAIAEGFALIDRGIDRIHEADRIRVVAQLRERRNRAQEAYTAFMGGRQKLIPARTAARKAEATAKTALDQAQAEHAEIARDEELARRYRHGVRAEAEKAVLLSRAAEALGRYESEHAAAARARAAEAAVDQADARAAQLENARDEAVRALADPGRIGYGAQAITAGLMRLLFGGQLTEPEQIIAGHIARQAVSLTGVMDDVEAEIRQQVKAEEEAERTSKPLILPVGPDGQRTAVAAPWNTSAPQQFHPPAPGNQPAAHQMPVIPGGFPV